MAEELRINIIGDATKLKSALGESGGQIDKFAEKIGKVGKTMTIVGGVVTAAFGAIVMKTTQLGDTYDKMAKRTNIAVETLSALGYAAKISGADLDTVEKSLRYLARGMDDMSRGVGEAKEAFEYLDISVIDTQGNLRPTIDVLKEAATKLAAMTDETKQIALATEIFGARYGTQLLPLLKEGGAGIEALMNKAKDLGIVMSTEAAAKAAEFNDRLTDLKEGLGAAGRGIGEILIPPLTKLAEKAIEIIKRIKDWADANKPLVEMIIKVGATLGVLAAVGGPILMAVSAFMKVKGAITAVGLAMKALTVSTGPIGWLILAVGALYLAWTTNFGGIQDFTLKVVEKVKEALGWLWDKVKWVLEKLGLYKEKTKEVIEATDELAKSTEEAGEKAEGATTRIDTLADSMEMLGEKTEETEKIMDEFGNFLESFDDWVARLAKEREEREEKETEKLTKELEKRKTLLERFADAQQSIADRIYELTHTKYEVALRDLDRAYGEHIQKIKEAILSKEEEYKAIGELNKWHELEKNALEESNKEKDKAIVINENLSDSYNNIGKELDKVSKKTKLYTGTLMTISEMIGTLGGYRRAFEKGGSAFAGSPPSAFLGSYQFGTPYVPKTQLALVHRGEEINPPGQRSYDQRKSYTSTSSINIMPGAIQIITPKFSEADGHEMFRIIEDQARMRGLKLVRA